MMLQQQQGIKEAFYPRSPGVHQDATMDNSYAMGFRSPSINALTGHGSPVPVRSLRDNEEEISSLRKENFNLKLRIYFLEQKAGICTDSDTPALGLTSSSSTNTSCDGNYLKQNIDLKVEVESLRQDVQNKHDLLCQAAKAMEVMEESHKKAEEKHREMVNDLNNRIEMHQLEIKSLEKMASELQHQYRDLQLSTSRVGLDEAANDQQHADTTTAIGKATTVRDNVGESLLDFLDTVHQHSELSVQEKLKLLEMDNAVRQCQERNEELSRQVEQLQAMIDEKMSKISQLEVELGELRFENAELREESEKPHTNVEQEHQQNCIKCVTVEQKTVGVTTKCFTKPIPNDSTDMEQLFSKPNVCFPCEELLAYRSGSATGKGGHRFKTPFPPAHLTCRRIINEWVNQYFIIESRPAAMDEDYSTNYWNEIEREHEHWPNIFQWCLQKLNLSSSGGSSVIERLKQQNFDIRSELAEKLCVLDDTEAKLREKTMECTKSCKMVEKLIKTITEQDKELEKLKRNSVRPVSD
uniref:Centrosomin N-terminal motif 1 domain-containing protein n=1 Tax=Anopheles maculatus TaxID=74869 RepID=A0A182SJD3_9DIPT